MLLIADRSGLGDGDPSSALHLHERVDVWEECFSGGMDGRRDECVKEGWVDGWTGWKHCEWMGGLMHWWMDGWMHELMHASMDMMDVLVNGWVDALVDGRMDGCM